MGHLLELAKLQIAEAQRDSERRTQAKDARSARTQPQSGLLRRLTRTTTKAA